MVRRVIMGNLGGGAYGLKISKPTVDVYTAATSDLIFNSAVGTTRILLKGTLTINNGSTTGTIYFATQSSKPIVDIRRAADPAEYIYTNPYTINGYSQNIFPWALAVTTNSFTLTHPSADHGGFVFAYLIYASAL